MQRWQVSVKQKSWTDPGPDLLRTRPNAIAQVLSLLSGRGHWWWRKQRTSGDWYDWRRIGDRKAVAAWLQDSLLTLNDGQFGQLGLGTARESPASVRVVIRGCGIPIPDLTGATGKAELAHGLTRYRFPDVLFGGSFVCKRISGSSSWSDHAWGDAVDWTENPSAGVRNDDIFDWELRMASEGLTPLELLIGSRDGTVVSAEAPSWNVVTGGASSHEWHTHGSCVRHTGVPPCAR